VEFETDCESDPSAKPLLLQGSYKASAIVFTQKLISAT
jgi:hypothetical protein